MHLVVCKLDVAGISLCRGKWQEEGQEEEGQALAWLYVVSLLAFSRLIALSVVLPPSSVGFVLPQHDDYKDVLSITAPTRVAANNSRLSCQDKATSEGSNKL